jgi:hypothetical protein
VRQQLLHGGPPVAWSADASEHAKETPVCINLHERLHEKDEPTCLPTPLHAGQPALAAQGI